MTRTRTYRKARRASSAIAALVALAATLASPQPGTAATHGAGPSAAYGWPIKPFHAQHPVRGFFGDPRIGHTDHGLSTSFHFGIDISCPNGTPVYATVSGRVVLEPSRRETVAVAADDGRTAHAYWHIAPAVGHGDRVVAYRTVVGHVLAPWAHVHFSEVRDGANLNPLRPGALGPFDDTTRPVLWSPRVEASSTTGTFDRLAGRVDLVVEAGDAHPLRVRGRWAGRPVMPSLIRWRIAGARGALGRWTTAVDFRLTIPERDDYPLIYARWTRQNRPGWRGRYRIYLTHALDTRLLRDGRYRLAIEALDTRGNRGTLSVPLRIANGSRDA